MAGLDKTYKILLLGGEGVGKSCFLLRYVENTYTETFIGSIGVDYKTKTVILDDKEVTLQIWDPTAEDRAITSSFYRGAVGVFVVFDVTNQESFDYVKDVFGAIDRFASEDVVSVLIGSKSDLDEERTVSKDTAQSYADELGVPYFEVSSKESTNINESFIEMSRSVQNIKKNSGKAPVLAQKTGKKKPKHHGKKECCLQ